MAVNQDDIKKTYPLPAYNYRVTVMSGFAEGATNMLDGGTANVISCSEVTGLNMEIETVSYRNGFSFVMGAHHMRGQIKEVQLTIKKGVTAQGSYLSDWMKTVYPNTFSGPLDITRKRDLLIDLCDEAGVAVVRWTVFQAMPIKLEAPTFNVNNNEVAFESMSFLASQLKVDYLNQK